jgi:hypothetical protein
MTSHSALATGHDPNQPTSLWNHNHVFNERLRCKCGRTWTQQVASPSLCPLDARGENRQNKPPRKEEG